MEIEIGDEKPDLVENEHARKTNHLKSIELRSKMKNHVSCLVYHH